MKRGRTRKAGPWGRIGWALMVLVCGIAIGHALSCRAEKRKSPAQSPQEVAAPKAAQRSSSSRRPTPPSSPVKAEPNPSPKAPMLPRLALVIDDLGYAAPEMVKRLCAQPIPLTVAVLPHQEHTRESAEIAHEAGKEVLVHLPMEPLGYPGPGKDPGPGAILASMGERETRLAVRQAIVDVPFRKGANNHMGSRITPDRKRMVWVLEELKARNLYFVDSRTEKDSVAFDVAGELGIRSVQRKVFLDDDKSFGEMERQWNRALDLARREGQVLVIGHIYPETLAALERLIPRSRDACTFVVASALAVVPSRTTGSGRDR